MLTKVCANVHFLSREVSDEGDLHEQEGEYDDDDGEHKFKEETFDISTNYPESLENGCPEMDPELMTYSIDSIDLIELSFY